MSGNDQVMLTVNNNTLSAVLSNLRYSTQYNCCVEAIFNNFRENALSCATRETQEGRKPISV